jgi:hypothetical protein
LYAWNATDGPSKGVSITVLPFTTSQNLESSHFCFTDIVFLPLSLRTFLIFGTTHRPNGRTRSFGTIRNLPFEFMISPASQRTIAHSIYLHKVRNRSRRLMLILYQMTTLGSLFLNPTSITHYTENLGVTILSIVALIRPSIQSSRWKRCRF